MSATSGGTAARQSRSVEARLTVSTIGFRGRPLGEALAAVRAAGFAAVDVGGLPGYCDHFDPAGSEEALAAFVAAVGGSGLRVHTLNVSPGDYNDAAADRAAIDRRVRHCLRAARAVGAHGVTIPAGRRIDRAREDHAAHLAAVAAAWRRFGPEAEALGLVLSFEAPHKGGLVHDAREARALVEACGHPAIRLVFDVGHHRKAGWTLADAWAMVGPWVDHLHLRDQADGHGRYPLGAGEIDFRELLGLLDRDGYAGCLGLEFPDAAPEPAQVVDLLRQSREHLLSLHP